MQIVVTSGDSPEVLACAKEAIEKLIALHAPVSTLATPGATLATPGATLATPGATPDKKRGKPAIAKTISRDDARAAMTMKLKAGLRDELVALLATYGVEKFGDLPDSKLVEFNEKVSAL